jgi:hypothetical protein
MSRVINLIEALRIRGGSKVLHEALFRCCHELFGYSRDEFKRRWRPKNEADRGTLRGYTQPLAEVLFDEWKAKRDPAWLYSHPEYKFDAIGVSVFQTSATTAGGVKLLRENGAEPKRIFDWGAGPGFSTIMMARNFPNAEVHYNETNDELAAIFEWFVRHGKITNVRRVSQPEGEYDVVQAYEIVEHILHAQRPAVGDPITETIKILANTTHPAFFLHSSCWSAENRFFTLGHFLRYDIGGRVMNTSRVGMHFRRAMADAGWHVVGTGWNSRPFLFKRA